MLSPEDNVLQLFRQAANRIPAYKDFLHKESIDPSKINTLEDFKQVTPVDKKNYLTKYPLKDLCWDGNLFDNRIISVSSGSTGEPFFWPRGDTQEQEGAWIHEQMYRDIFDIGNKSTLVVICFSMGTWIAGSFTTACTIEVANKGYKINVITPGLEKEEIIKAVKRLSPLYEQTVIAGYPPFVKDVIDEGYREGIKWKKFKTRFLWAGEAFSEEWRDYVLRLVGSRDPFFDSVNIYGTADASILGHETPVSILLRRLYNRRKTISEQLFGTPILPAIVQYYPQNRYFEAINNELVFSANAGIPLLRYNIHDSGGIIAYEDMIKPVKAQFYKELDKHHINKVTWQLPFIYLNGRKDFTVTIYAVNIYPENIKAALVDPKMRSWVTGRFTMATKYHSDMDQYFEINIEVAKGVNIEDDYENLAKKTIMKKLMTLNAEFHKLNSAIGKKSEPVIHLIPYGDERYFKNGVKHRWVKKEQ
ncbi:MAG TPA: hypothetical protein VLE69_02720 [Candidatus Saccharimonadales bacterium]|nr:hypothetical protein [Candidatus Saccharimonadales bacterium]